ncbi:ACP S-malonyltransferase [Salimicrobium salexigens]|uniref:Malonyl CoA-acyl carrier protein transacylase n=1 Tax=Salimicrobium salexigens TaxID=908941 RepID=A0ABY1KQ48_9BACI|nr:ACP S-malonyltransferase [Salimicrobium salexigens]SIS62627.1 [Acyl-carrier-protein] S-malonyltransferase [Salimicrobium salexigens]
MKKVAFVFPGQGSQKVGMGKEMYDSSAQVKKLFDEADEALGYSLTSLMFEGPEEELTKTENAQPALLLVSVAIDQLLKEEGIRPAMTAGHSLGEYSALVSSGSLGSLEALRLVHNRGKLMEEAYPSGKGAMSAVLGLSVEEIQEKLEQVDGVVNVANINCPGQIVISGDKPAVQSAGEILQDKAKRVMPLNVSGPFHSDLMKPAADDFEDHLHKATVRDAEIPVYANVTAAPVTEKDEISRLLVEQLYSPVRFQETVEAFVNEGVDAVVEIGEGKVLSGLVRKVARRMKTFQINNEESLETFINWYREGEK